MKKILILLLAAVSLNAQNSNRLNEGMNYYNNGEYASAYKVLEELTETDGIEDQEIAEAKFFSANSLMKLGQIDGASAKFESFIEKFPFSSYRITALYNLGMLYLNKNEYRKVRDRLNQLLTYYPFNEYTGSVHYWIAESYLAENKYLEAQESFKESIKNQTTNAFPVNTLFSLAQSFEKSGDYNSAVAYYDELLTYYKEHSLAHKSQYRIGVCYFNLKDYDNAVIELSDPVINNLDAIDLIDAKMFLAASYIRLREYTQAKNTYTDLLSKSLTNQKAIEINYSLAWVNFQLNDFENAFRLFNLVSAETGDTLSIQALYWSGESKRYLNETDQAQKIFNKFIEQYPSHPFASRAQLGIGTVKLQSANQPNSEKSLINASLSNDINTRTRALTMLGELRLQNKRYDDSRKYFNDVVNSITQDKAIKDRADLGLAVSLFYLNDYDKASSVLEALDKRSKNFENDKVSFYLAESYLAQKKYSPALKKYNSIKSGDEKIKEQTILGKAYSYYNMKDYANSAIFFKEFVSLYKRNPSYEDALMRLADSYFGTKNFDKAAEIYKQIFDSESSAQRNDIAYYQYAQSLFKSGKSAEAKIAFNRLQSSFPRSEYKDESQYVIGWIDFQQSRFEDAIQNFSKLISSYPSSNLVPMATYSIGDSYFNLGRYDSSIIFYSKVLQNYPNTPSVFDAVNGIQYAFIAEDKPQEAIRFIDEFVDQHSASKYSDQIYFKKGDLYYSIADYQNASAAYQSFINRFPQSSLLPNAYFWIGKSSANLQKKDDAANNFIKAKDIAPKSEIGISAVVELVSIYSGENNHASALNLLRETIARVPNSNRVPELLYLQGTTEVKNKNVEEAASSFEQIISFYEGSIFAVKAKLELAMIELSRKNYEKADLLLIEVGEKRTDDLGAQAQYFYGLSLLQQNKIQDAITALVRVRSVFAGYDEWYTKSLLSLGDCYVKLKDKKLAREMFKAVLNRHSSGQFAEEAKKKMSRL